MQEEGAAKVRTRREEKREAKRAKTGHGVILTTERGRIAIEETAVGACVVRVGGVGPVQVLRREGLVAGG